MSSEARSAGRNEKLFGTLDSSDEALVHNLAERRATDTLATAQLTDYGNAERLLVRHGADLRYAVGLGWLVWDGRRWAPDKDGAVMRRAKDTVRTMFKVAANLPAAERDALIKHAQRSESRAKLDAMIALAQTEQAALVAADELDSDPWLLTVLNGAIDLRAGELRPHDRRDFGTKLAPVEYDPDARDPRWERFLAETTGGEVELAEFLQRAAGYSLTGDTSEEKLILAHGPAATGKSTFLDALRGTFGDYATTADFETFLQRRDASGPRNGLAQLAGARLVTSIEVDEGKALAEALVKTITGGDTVRASFLYRDSFEFRPTFKLWLAANHAPKVSDDDDAMWRRIVRVPFEHQVPPKCRDRTLKAHLRQPNPAVLAWAVKGCLAWQEHGLAAPETVDRATEAYREQMDPLREFLAERCVLDADAQVPISTLRQDYESWAWDRSKGAETAPISPRAFNERLKAVPCKEIRPYIDGERTRAWSGIALLDDTSGTTGTGGS